MPEHPRESDMVDGYDREVLASCLAARGLIVAPESIVAVSHSGACVEFGDGECVWGLPRWFEAARGAAYAASQRSRDTPNGAS